ncbi:hypothetical protein MSC49_22810 [Methylosinus sp. C49]|uniref:DUF4365 domain-containing protein n=1 Tax=Methylosinus sp. C49 TaxID=2699395 RepID=UPI00136774D8|nr:DUF4365 domain-containing protein [Methylosinus sp. C49]BBU62346.1 hypothetical protein MSC49_22810 [Methylosinus sp. C49]
MPDSLLSTNDREEDLSRAYVQAIAAMAGYQTAEFKPDRDGTDIQIRAGGSMRPSLDIQLKATINLGESKDGKFSYALKRRNYDLLREPTLVPNILVLLALPSDRVEWLTVAPEQLVIRRCAYWASLKGLPESANKETVTMYLDDEKRFDVESLKALMEQARSGAVG